MAWMNELMNEYFIYQHNIKYSKTAKSRTVSTGQKCSKSTYKCPKTTVLDMLRYGAMAVECSLQLLDTNVSMLEAEIYAKLSYVF